MKRTLAFVLFALHAGLLALASSRFTLLAQGPAQAYGWDFCQISLRRGWGELYVSGYSLPLVLAYLAAFGLGLAAYWVARPLVHRAAVGLGAVLCLLGVLSFAQELTHWAFDHHFSLIITFQVLSLALAAVALVQLALNKTSRECAGTDATARIHSPGAPRA